jgi:hypothetical protein
MIERAYYPLSDLALRWGCTVQDLLHLGAQDGAQVCVNLYGMVKGKRMEAIEDPPDDGEPNIEPKSVEEETEAQVWDAAFRRWKARVTTDMPQAIYELGIDDLRFCEMPGGLPHPLAEAERFDRGRWWHCEFEPPVHITAGHLCLLREEVERLDREVFGLGRQSGAERSIDAADARTDRDLGTKERNTLLTIIASLCDYSAIDLKARGVAGQIAKMTEEIGAPVTDDTIRKVIAQVNDALESRAK